MSTLLHCKHGFSSHIQDINDFMKAHTTRSHICIIDNSSLMVDNPHMYKNECHPNRTGTGVIVIAIKTAPGLDKRQRNSLRQRPGSGFKPQGLHGNGRGRRQITTMKNSQQGTTGHQNNYVNRTDIHPNPGAANMVTTRTDSTSATSCGTNNNENAKICRDGTDNNRSGTDLFPYIMYPELRRGQPPFVPVPQGYSPPVLQGYSSPVLQGYKSPVHQGYNPSTQTSYPLPYSYIVYYPIKPRMSFPLFGP